MLRPERMSRVSVTGSKRVMDEVVETVHDLRLLHVTEYDGSWEGFSPGAPDEGADEASSTLVTVRSLQNILDVSPDDVETTQVVTEEALETELEEIRQEVNALDDERDAIRDDLRAVEEQIDAMEPFVDLGIPLDLLQGYDSLAVRVGEGDADSVRATLSGALDAYDVESADGTVAVFAYTDEETLDEVLVDATFTGIEIPDGEGSPEEYLDRLRERERQLESDLADVEAELDEVREEVGGFLLAAEEELAIEVSKREAPLSFATTANAFVAEGWIPTGEYDSFVAALHDAVGDHVEIQELERAEYDGEGHVTDREPVEEGPPGQPEPTAADGSGEARADGGPASGATGSSSEPRSDGGSVSGASTTSSEPRSDGGTVTMSNGAPPVIQNNPAVAKPFELLVGVINRPKYSEYDPTLILLLTFPAMFGFMIGDVGYGVLYMAVGWLLYTQVDSAGWQALGGIAVWSGVFTFLFGILYGEVFGLHFLTDIVWKGVVGLSEAPMHKGLQPAEINFAQAWLLFSLFVGLAHLTLGYLFGFLRELSHGVAAAVTEKGSWVLMMGGVWAFVFSTAAAAAKPAFMFEVFAAEGATNPVTGAEIAEHSVAYSLGFTGFPEAVGLAGLAVTAVGLVLLLAGEGVIGLLESLNVLVNVLSYTRIAAVLLAKAGMAFVVNLLVFGVYTEETGHGAEWHFGTDGMPAQAGVEFHGYEVAEIIFPGLIHADIAVVGVLAGVLILALGHLLVLALGITSAGLQAVRLEYVEFFGKFYDGGGDPFEPFGRERRFTTDD